MIRGRSARKEEEMTVISPISQIYRESERRTLADFGSAIQNNSIRIQFRDFVAFQRLSRDAGV